MTGQQRPGSPTGRGPSLPLRAVSMLLAAKARRQEGKAFHLHRSRQQVDAFTDRLMRLPRGVTQTEQVIAGVPVVRYASQGNVGVVLYFHGGAYTLGTASQGATAAHVCAQGGPEVISVGYRLAPEHPFPAAIDDAIAVYRELVRSVGADQLVVAGDSAGGGLMLLMLQRARDEGLPMPAGAATAFPWTDMSMSRASWTRNLGRDMLVRSEVEQSARWFAGEVDRQDASVSPLFGTFHDFPRTYIAVGTRDLTLDDSRQLKQALTRAGVDVVLDEWPGAIHAFTALPLREGRQFRQRLRHFVRAALSATPRASRDDSNSEGTNQ